MKKTIILLGTLLATLLLQAQDIIQDSIVTQDSIATTNTIATTDTITPAPIKVAKLIIDSMQNVVVHQDSTIRQLMIDKQLGTERGQTFVNGFRIQVYSSNQQHIAKNEALILQQQLESLFTLPVYAISEPPFWKVRVGNFLTREEATLYITELISLRPDLQSSTYIVPDKVIISK